jgi:hypothetical protein
LAVGHKNFITHNHVLPRYFDYPPERSLNLVIFTVFLIPPGGLFLDFYQLNLNHVGEYSPIFFKKKGFHIMQQVTFKEFIATFILFGLPMIIVGMEILK